MLASPSIFESSNPRPSHRPYPFPLDPPPIIIHPAKPIHARWTVFSSPNSDHPPNPMNPGRGLKFDDLQPFWLVELTLKFGELDIEVTAHYHLQSPPQSIFTKDIIVN